MFNDDALHWIAAGVLISPSGNRVTVNDWRWGRNKHNKFEKKCNNWSFVLTMHCSSNLKAQHAPYNQVPVFAVSLWLFYPSINARVKLLLRWPQERKNTSWSTDEIPSNSNATGSESFTKCRFPRMFLILILFSDVKTHHITPIKCKTV